MDRQEGMENKTPMMQKRTMNMTVFEYGRVPKDEWSKEELCKIERLNAIMGVEILSIGFKQGKDVVMATSYVGFIRIGKTIIEILPKVDKDGDKRLAAQNLLYFLSYTRKLSIKESDIARLTERTSEFFEILIYLFARNLWELIKKGMYKEYVAEEKYAGFLKGKWLISQQLTQRPTTRHSFYVSYDEFTEDNPFNRIFKYAVILFQKLSNNPRNQQLLLELSFAFNDIEFEIITKEHFVPLNVNRLNSQYLPVLELARLFILDSSLQMTANNIETFSFVFDMNRLFEEFVYEFIRRHRDAILPEDLKDCEIRAQSSDRYLLYTPDGMPVFKLQPDIVFIKLDGSIPLIIDTKYKLLKSQDNNSGISQSDMYQMFAYAKKYQCNRVIMLYPHRTGVEEKSFKFDESGGRYVDIRTLDIGKDLPKDKQAFIKQLQTIVGGKYETSDCQHNLEQ